MSKDNWALIEEAVKKIDLDDIFENLLDERLNRSYQVGISVGLDKAAAVMLAKAHAHFEVGNDELASRFRDLHKELKNLAKKEHPGVEK